MIFADKLIALRKKAGWSQEELAQQLNVSRQSVSKWEGAQSVPDLDKIVQLSRIFGVSTDYLLKDELEAQETAEPEPEQPICRRVSLEEASQYLGLRKQAAPWLALATFLCVLSPITLILLAGLSEYTARISENVAGGIGLCVLILLVAAAVGIFLMCGFPSKIREKREEKWMNVYGKGCCWPSAGLSAKQLPYAPRIPDFSRPVVNRL